MNSKRKDWSVFWDLYIYNRHLIKIKKLKKKYFDESLINYKSKIKNPVAEVIGINKISSFTAENIFAFMDKYLVKNNKRLTYE